jgi:hypothetical protein
MKLLASVMLCFAIYWFFSCSKSNKTPLIDGLLEESAWHLHQVDSIGYDTILGSPFHHTIVYSTSDCQNKSTLTFYSNGSYVENSECTSYGQPNGTWNIRDSILYETFTIDPRGAAGLISADTIKVITSDSLVLSQIHMIYEYNTSIADPSQPLVLYTYTH